MTLFFFIFFLDQVLDQPCPSSTMFQEEHVHIVSSSFLIKIFLNHVFLDHVPLRTCSFHIIFFTHLRPYTCPCFIFCPFYDSPLSWLGQVSVNDLAKSLRPSSLLHGVAASCFCLFLLSASLPSFEYPSRTSMESLLRCRSTPAHITCPCQHLLTASQRMGGRLGDSSAAMGSDPLLSLATLKGPYVGSSQGPQLTDPLSAGINCRCSPASISPRRRPTFRSCRSSSSLRQQDSGAGGPGTAAPPTPVQHRRRPTVSARRRTAAIPPGYPRVVQVQEAAVPAKGAVSLRACHR